MTLENVLAVCVLLQFILIAVLYSRSLSHSNELQIVYLFMREVDADAFYRVVRRLNGQQ